MTGSFSSSRASFLLLLLHRRSWSRCSNSCDQTLDRPALSFFPSSPCFSSRQRRENNQTLCSAFLWKNTAESLAAAAASLFLRSQFAPHEEMFSTRVSTVQMKTNNNHTALKTPGRTSRNRESDH